MVSLVEAGEDPDVVYAEQAPTFSLSKARGKIFAPDMTIQKLSELMGGDDKWRIVNWKYVARMNGTYNPPPPPLYFQLPLLRSFLRRSPTCHQYHQLIQLPTANRPSTHPRIPPTQRHTLPPRHRTLDRLRRRSRPLGRTQRSKIRFWRRL